jgi:hypothetical protein
MQPCTRLDWLIETIPELREQTEWVQGDSAPWVAGKRLAMDVLVRDLLQPFVERGIRLGDREMVERLCHALDAIVVGKDDEALVNAVREQASRAFPGISPRVVYPRVSRLWVTDLPNILDAECIALVRSALLQGDVIFSFHMYYYGGRGGDWWAATDLESYLRRVEAARPGDLFWVHALDQLRARGYVLAHAEWPESQQSPEDSLRGEALARIEAYLRENQLHSVVLVWRSLDPAVPAAGICGDCDSTYLDDGSLLDCLHERLAEGAGRPGAVYAFREADLEKLESALVKAKRPNERGEVPIGGAY